jgi:hypothetical protein
MVKRTKRLEKGIESLKKEIEVHFSKLEQDIKENQIDREDIMLKRLIKVF